MHMNPAVIFVILPMRIVYRRAIELGIAAFFVSARNPSVQEETRPQLKENGFYLVGYESTGNSMRLFPIPIEIR